MDNQTFIYDHSIMQRREDVLAQVGPDQEGGGLMEYPSLNKRTETDNDNPDDAGAADVVPDFPDGYNFEPVQGVPEDLYNPEGVAKFQGVAHTLGLTKSQAEGLHKWFYEDMRAGSDKSMDEAKKVYESDIDALKTGWGSRYDENVGIAQRAYDAIRDVDFDRLIDASGIGGSPHLMRALYRLGEKLEASGLLPEPPAKPKSGPIQRDQFGQALLMFPSLEADTHKEKGPAGDQKEIKRDQFGQAILEYPSMEKKA